MTAFQTAKKLGRKAAQEILCSAGIGLKPSAVLVTALRNADADGLLTELIRRSPENFADALAAVAFAAGAEKMIVHLPAGAEDLAPRLACTEGEAELTCATGLVNLRAHADSCILSYAAVADSADLLAGTYVPGTYLSADGQPLRKIPSGTRLGDLIDFSAAKAVEAGWHLLRPDEGDLTVGEAKIENGVLRGIGHGECLVRLAEARLHRSREISCGKCVFCREGLIQLEGFDHDLTGGNPKPETLSYLKEIGEAMVFSTPCSVGQTSSLLLLDAMAKFPEEFGLHLRRRECPAGQCFVHETVYVDPSLCTGCGDCVPVCPVNAIDGKPGYIHLVDDFDCTVCGACLPVCPAGAIRKTKQNPPRLPDRFIPAGRFKRY